MQLNSLDDVLHEQIEDLYSAEQQLVKALPKMAPRPLDRAAGGLRAPSRGDAGPRHEAPGDLGQLGIACPASSARGWRASSRRATKIDRDHGDPAAKDAALIAAAQRVEHYEIAAYGTARTLADVLDLDDAKDLLDQTLDEEADADKLLTKIATGGMLKAGVNEAAV